MDLWTDGYGECDDEELLPLKNGDQRVLAVEVDLDAFDALWQTAFGFGASQRRPFILVMVDQRLDGDLSDVAGSLLEFSMETLESTFGVTTHPSDGHPSKWLNGFHSWN